MTSLPPPAIAPLTPETGCWEWDSATDTVRWDAPMHALFGLEPGTFAGGLDDFLNHIHFDEIDDARRAVSNAMLRTLQHGLSLREEVRAERGGSLRNLLLEGEALPGKACWHDGKSPGLRGTCRPLGADDHAGVTPGMERLMFEALMEYLPDNVYFKDRSSRIIAVSREFAKWVGAGDPQELRGKTDFDLFGPEHARAAREDEREIMEFGRGFKDKEEEEQHLDGSVVPVSSTKQPLRDKSGKIIGTFGLSQNITRRKQAEEELQKKNTELKSANGELEKKNAELKAGLDSARCLQHAMLQQPFPAFTRNGAPVANFARFFQTSEEVGGDFFSVYKVAEDRVGLFICDVMGHGVQPALLAATIRALGGRLAMEGSSPEALLAALNREMCQLQLNVPLPDRRFVTACYMVVDFSRQHLVCANSGSGQTKPILIRRREPARPLALPETLPSPGGESANSALGLFENARYDLAAFDFTPGDALLLFTDGLIEAENGRGELYDYKRLLASAQKHAGLPLQTLCDKVVEEAKQFASHTFDDDVCLLGMEWAACSG